jgi:hypothetical protein
VALGEDERYGAEPPWVVYAIIVGFVVLLALGVTALVAWMPREGDVTV